MSDLKLRSKDEEYMEKLRGSVYAGMLDSTHAEKRAAWRLMQRRVFLQDIQKLAVNKLNAKSPVYIGTGHFSPKVAVVTSVSLDLSKDASDLVHKMVSAMKIPEVFYTSRYKTAKPVKGEVPIHDEILLMELKAVKPKIILSFGDLFDLPMHSIEEYQSFSVVQTMNLQGLLTPGTSEIEQKKIKTQIWDDMKQITTFLGD